MSDVTAFHFTVPAEPGSPGVIRRRLGQWLESRTCSAQVVGDLLLATSEAVTNSAEHAYPDGQPGEITIDATLDGGHDAHSGHRRIAITVTDHGCWRLPPLEAGFRGRGLAMIRALVAQLLIEHTGTGTRVRMISHPC